MTPEEALKRVADIRVSLTSRLLKRGWNAQEKLDHTADLKELDDLLGAASDTYLPDMERLREEAKEKGQ